MMTPPLVTTFLEIFVTTVSLLLLFPTTTTTVFANRVQFDGSAIPQGQEAQHILDFLVKQGDVGQTSVAKAEKEFDDARTNLLTDIGTVRSAAQMLITRLQHTALSTNPGAQQQLTRMSQQLPSFLAWLDSIEAKALPQQQQMQQQWAQQHVRRKQRKEKGREKGKERKKKKKHH